MRLTDPLTPPPGHDPTPEWSQSLGAGAAGIALLHVAYAHSGAGDQGTAHQWVTAMTRHPVVADPDACGLFRGAPAVAYVLRIAARPEYATALAALDGHITALTRCRLDRAHQRIERGQLPRLREFDLINGLTGIGVYLLHARHTELLREVLSYLVRLTEPITVDGQTVPGWWTGHGPADHPSPDWPGGHGNLGMAHGIAGPLALLASATLDGITVPGQTDTIDHLDTWLDGWRCGTPSRPWWPGMITRTEYRTGSIGQPGPQRPSWCYGTPGLARARQLAGRALADPPRRRRAEAALASCIADDGQLARLRDGSLCHGWAGLAHTAWRAAADAGADSDIARLLPPLLARWRQENPQLSDPEGMLEGAAGVALVQHTITSTPTSVNTGTPPAARWDACLLTAPPALQETHLEGSA